MTQPNQPQIEAWNGITGNHFVRHRERFEGMFRRLTPHLLRAADVRPDERVLDVGCGAGATTRALAAAAPRGGALGLDVSEPLLAEARRITAEQGPGNAGFALGDAQTYALPAGERDVVVSRFGVMFFADPAAAFGRLAAALRPGGRLAVLCWRTLAENAHFAVPYGAVRGLAPEGAQAEEDPEDREDGSPGPFSLADPDRVRGILAGAGFRDVELRPLDEPVRMAADLDDALDYLLDTPEAARLLAAAPDPTPLRAKATTLLRPAL
ncbi:hypothetical protein BIV57_18540, partial [Mangrovactinospora gilvigrisea]